MTNPDCLSQIEERVEKRWRHLTDVITETVTEGLKYLTVVHLAGMGGVLSFMGATKTTGPFLIGAFFCFFVGAASVGICYFYRYFHFLNLVKGWITDTGEMFAGGSMHWRTVLTRDRARTDVRRDFGVYAAIVSYACFLLGGASGFIGVYLFVAKAAAA
ncbi:hypothetical protein ACN22W_36825 [Burkholderia theae]|uniref:hypothetical protein n=1 Tax=Burkholderia theae TaxID=3143496 RepID=UPI003AFB4A8B